MSTGGKLIIQGKSIIFKYDGKTLVNFRDDDDPKDEKLIKDITTHDYDEIIENSKGCCISFEEFYSKIESVYNLKVLISPNREFYLVIGYCEMCYGEFNAGYRRSYSILYKMGSNLLTPIDCINFTTFNSLHWEQEYGAHLNIMNPDGSLLDSLNVYEKETLEILTLLLCGDVASIIGAYSKFDRNLLDVWNYC